ncbi:hypothetical protein AVEN_62067-1 [Araneus ventricosus]|uniref:Uncharacterized protein n=1 Tax=Araneus ventricosus TaxID=182803 RepID=A0A4Y2VJC6_ARAVE|nr:hypothetical protein AVEN_62067-1 [Araneus ventricosus]
MDVPPVGGIGPWPMKAIRPPHLVPELLWCRPYSHFHERDSRQGSNSFVINKLTLITDTVAQDRITKKIIFTFSASAEATHLKSAVSNILLL